MSSPERIYSGSISALSLIFIGLGLLILVSTLTHGGGPLSLGVLMGVAFLAVGIARLWLTGIFRGWRRGKGGWEGGVR